MANNPPREPAGAEDGTEDLDQVNYDVDRDVGTHLEDPGRHHDRVAPFAGSVDPPSDDPGYDLERDVGL